MTEKLVLHPPLRAFFERHSEVKEIHFGKFWVKGPFEIEIVKADPPLVEGLSRFDFGNAGDRFFFEKEFGPFPFPDSLYAMWLKRMADVTDINGKIHHDSIFFTITQTRSSPDDKKIFTKKESRADYKEGLHILAHELADSLSCLTVPACDSILLFKAFLERKGKMTVLSTEKGDSTGAYTKAIIGQVNSSGPWSPYEIGGSTVRSYEKLYIRIYPDKTYRIAMRYPFLNF